MQTKKETTNPKIIIYIGDFIASYATENYITYAFRELGNKVITMQYNHINFENPKQCVRELEEYRPDIILFSKAKPKGEPEKVIELLKENGITTVCWLFDLYIDIQNRHIQLKNKNAPFNCKYLFSTDGGHQERFKEMGIDHKLLRQGIYDKEAILYDRKKIYGVIFVGSDFFGTRKNMLDGLKMTYGLKFKRFGFPFTQEIRGLKLNELYASTKIVVGDSQPSPKYWSNRIYETLGRGGFLIHPYVEGLEEEFEIGKDLVCYPYGDNAKLHELIDYYLENDDEREAIRKHGFETVKNKYTYKKRCEELLKQI